MPCENPGSLFDSVQQQARRQPDRIALIAPQIEAISYRQLGVQVVDIGTALRNAGVGTNDRVAVVLPNGPGMALAFVAIASFATCAPLNPAYRENEFEFYLSDLQAKAIMLPAGKDHPARRTAKKMGIKILDVTLSSLSSGTGLSFQNSIQPSETDPRPADGDDTALVLHTSGTTSRPKQVPLSHTNLCCSAGQIADALQLTPDDRCLNVMPLFHIHGLIGALLSSIVSGGSVVCSAGFSSDNFGDLIRQYAPTWYTAVPTIHQSVLSLSRQDASIVANSHFRLIRSSSSALPPSLMEALEERFQVPVIESYGMTEASHQMASNPLPPARRKPGSVGMPAGPEMAIMDDAGRLLGAKAIGEIVIRGPSVTSGYTNNAKANEESFVDGWFRTGDLGRSDDDGYFFITGRKKEMINRGGENISPREIDEALLGHPAVAQAVAFAVPHTTLGEDVAAVVVLEDGTDTGEPELREHAFKQLAGFKVPSQIVFADRIPKGATGKLQRIGLHEQLASLLKPDFVQPQDPLESKLAALWMELLDLPQVGRFDNFFACGGDSLLAARLVARVRADLHVEAGLEALFRHPTLQAQAALIDRLLPALNQIDEEDLLALLDELEGMSDQEAAQLLAEEGRQRGPSGR